MLARVAKELDRREAERLRADVLDVVHDALVRPDRVVLPLVGEAVVLDAATVGEAHAGAAAAVAAVEVARPVPMERQPLAGREVDVPDANAVVLEQLAAADDVVPVRRRQLAFVTRQRRTGTRPAVA